MNRRVPLAALAACLAWAWASPALADPCEKALPAKGTSFSGIVRYVGDGDRLCDGLARRPSHWIEVRLADFYAPELHERGGQVAKRRLQRIVMGKTLVCRAGRRSYDRVVGACTAGGRPLGTVLGNAGGVEGGRGKSR
ncbi:nuclease [Sphingobium sp. SCG-1]|uniref:thermonuclease family protein n=1 Tax=Sphingobium sp. SCG-1 TaxID=2072936 RepID=UPI000CD6C326|nr:nuclease [Sphingobium sp. SCG-1]AUW59278.1 nuclease [Sphingobium sp. SCG-1]